MQYPHFPLPPPPPVHLIAYHNPTRQHRAASDSGQVKLCTQGEMNEGCGGVR